jgi:tRNA A37 N6-isopentenylltransferase MiaA
MKDTSYTLIEQKQLNAHLHSINKEYGTRLDLLEKNKNNIIHNNQDTRNINDTIKEDMDDSVKPLISRIILLENDNQILKDGLHHCNAQLKEQEYKIAQNNYMAGNNTFINGNNGNNDGNSISNTEIKIELPTNNNNHNHNHNNTINDNNTPNTTGINNTNHDTINNPSEPTNEQLTKINNIDHSNYVHKYEYNDFNKYIRNEIDKLHGRVSLLESKNGGTFIQNTSSGSLPDLSTFEQQFHASTLQLANQDAEIQKLHALIKNIDSIKADKLHLNDKANQNTVDDINKCLIRYSERLDKHDKDIDHLNNNTNTLEKNILNNRNKLNDLINNLNCFHCKSSKPSIKCNTCNQVYCDNCDTHIHESSNTSNHIRTPLSGYTRDNTAERIIELQSSENDNELFNKLKKYIDEQILNINKKDKQKLNDINDIFESIKEVKKNISDINNKDNSNKLVIEDILSALKRLEIDLNGKITAVNNNAKQYTDLKSEELLNKLNDFEKMLSKLLHTELKKFERDMMIFLEDNKNDHTEASIGKIHFRCITCDQYTNTVSGPTSLLFNKTITNKDNGATQMNIEKGKEIYLNGRDGRVYLGRDQSIVTVTPGDPMKNASFNISYHDKKTSVSPYGDSVPHIPTTRISDVDEIPQRPHTSQAVVRPPTRNAITKLPPARSASRMSGSAVNVTR